jgi:hypothetical protein
MPRKKSGKLAGKVGAKKAGQVFQFKVTLERTQPAIWRRIQVPNGTLDTLHEHIQTAMGWTNSHLHQFLIEGERYGDPDLLDDDVGDAGFLDSTITKISAILPKNSEQFTFNYEYDFGDGWRHTIVCEGTLPADPTTEYPRCVEGERSCPPEDVGGVRGYAEFLKALADPKHKRHSEFLEWHGPFDPDVFDTDATTTAMRKGLPDWRSEEEDW